MCMGNREEPRRADKEGAARERRVSGDGEKGRAEHQRGVRGGTCTARGYSHRRVQVQDQKIGRTLYVRTQNIIFGLYFVCTFD